MQRRTGWTRPLVLGPLLLGALLGVSGCTFPQSFGLAHKQKPQADEQLAQERPAPAIPDAEAVGPTMMFAAAGPKKTSWFSFNRGKPATPESMPLRDQASRGESSRPRTSSRPFLPAERSPEADTATHLVKTPRDAAAEAPKKSLMQSLRHTPSWLSFGRRKPKSTDDQPLADKNVPSTEPRQQLVYPNVVPPKYRNMGEAAQSPAIATDTAGSPSLVRPSRRPPPDPAPAPPTEQPAEQQVVRAPVTDGRLFDIIATASQSWRAKTGGPAATATASAATRQLVTEPHLKFTSPDLAARERKTHSKPTDLVKNMLRPAQSAAGTAGKQAATDLAASRTTPSVATTSRAIPATNWLAKKPPTPPVSAAETAGAWPSPRQESVTSESSAHSSPSTVVANTFHAGPPNMSVAVGVASSAKPRESHAVDRAVVAQNPTVPAVTLPDRSDVVARTENAGPAAPPQAQRTFLAKTRSHARATAPTHAAAVSPEVAAAETLAPLVDAQTYRATLAEKTREQPAPVRTAERPQSPAPLGSWVNTYQQLMQGNLPPAVPRPSAGSPQRRLSSDDGPELPEFPAPILRR